MVISETIRNQRQKLNISQSRMARLMNKDRTNIWRFETGRSDWLLHDVVKACDILGLEIIINCKEII